MLAFVTLSPRRGGQGGGTFGRGGSKSPVTERSRSTKVLVGITHPDVASVDPGVGRRGKVAADLPEQEVEARSSGADASSASSGAGTRKGRSSTRRLARARGACG